MSQKFNLQPLVAAMALICTSTLSLAHNGEEHHPKTMAPIVLTAQKANDANGLVIHADPKQPTQPIPAVDGAAYLQSIIGFNQVKSGGANSDVTFRGMFGSRIKILTDGTENLGACPSRMDSPTSYISPESYDRITVIKGPQTVQYAHTGSAATVSFEREPEKLTADKAYRGQASVLIGSYGRLDHNVEAAIGDETKYARLNSSRSVSDSYQDGDGNKVPSDWKKWNADLALGWTPDDDTWLELKGGKSDGEMMYAGRGMDGSQFKRESLGFSIQKKNLTPIIQQVDAQIDYSYNDHIMDNFSLRTPPRMGSGGGHGHSMHMAHSRPKAHAQTMQHGSHDMGHGSHDMGPNRMSMQVTRRTLNARANMTLAWDKFKLITGVDSQQNKHGGNMLMLDMPNMSSDFFTNMKFESYGAFGELSYQLNDANTVITGVRVDQSKISNFQRDQKPTQTRKETLPSAFIRLENEMDQQGLKSYIGLGYVERVPDYWELFSTTAYHSNDNVFRDLKNEKTTQLDMGLQYDRGAFNAWASAYAGQVNDFILMRYVDGKAKSRNIDANIAGAEAGVGYQFNDHIQADLSAMYAWGKNKDDHKPLAQISPLEGRMNLRYVADKYNVGLLWRVVASQNRVSLNDGNIVGYDLKKSDSFNTLSLNATYNLSSGIDLSVGVDNLFNTSYTEHLNKLGNAGFGYAVDQQFNNIGRNYWARMSMKF
ncbi:TonB-dependent receptor domain-containing protein [Acinetobacter larvae]|uniref:TonB-dependent copper receptor n=1 Tax=Acinetobacter larvae TaxID=1789224 RepID=A0A1B2M2U2_9GAMM|nr:TonB-dependent receptor [Acinetobacter larvae]AOA59508.1 TonB-dependent copper receptor [Acinetobacter larvae]